ncbi:hypothetical protein [Pantanalinema sp. GBBB05]|uniref:hypothetical protein n=1 Tax=Pantanalinema sp. GBBB05 TaxID=2604139 RepID=UPI001DC66575|nr:hypothetical protein [Pantanalinema sp. GBBB05]
MTNEYPETYSIGDLLVRLPEPNRSSITTKHLELLKFITDNYQKGITPAVQGSNEGKSEGDPEVVWPPDFLEVRDDLLHLGFIVNLLPEPAHSKGLEKLMELAELTLTNTPRNGTILDMPMQYVQFSKDYLVGDSVTQILGLTYEYGYTDEEVLEKTRFLITSDSAIKKHNPDAEHIYWEAPIPEGGQYVEGSFSCTGVVYRAIPEQYIHQHYQATAPVCIVDGMWQYVLDDRPALDPST